ncbi:unnamed protein product [Auanema sp. JU1783]|nr:unnamed protein product [Auanema sp. JU1783]
MIRWSIVHAIVCLTTTVLAVHQADMSKLENSAQRRAENLHHLDTIVLLTYITVMVVIVLTAWFFKHRRFPFIHESGLTLIYGLLIGMVIKYFNIGLLESQTFDVILKNSTIVSEPPDYLRLEVKPDGGQKVSFHYELIEGFFADTKKHNEHKIEQKSTFSPEIFFNILLPPIIFNAGYSLKKRNFFRNIGSILAFVFVGTTISCLATGIIMLVLTKMFGMGYSFQELLFFGAVISATDPVTVISIFSEMKVEADLFALVFGESALNDAVAIVLSNIIDNFTTGSSIISWSEMASILWLFFSTFVGSLLLGSGIGCANALMTKMTNIADYPLLESSLFVLVSYLSFLIGEVAGFTGIVAVLFCGIAQAHYTFNNLSRESQASSKNFFQMIAFVLESFIFCYIGVSVVAGNQQKWSLAFIFFALIAIVVARALFVYPLCTLINITRRPIIPRRYQHMIVFSGLRGAMAFALSARNTATEHRQVISSTTSTIVLITVFLNGGLASWMIDFLGIKHGEAASNSRTNTVSDDGNGIRLPNTSDCDDVQIVETPLTPHGPSGSNPWDKAFLPRKWYNFDSSFMKPLLTHATPSLEQTLPPCCYPLAKVFTSERQRSVSGAYSNPAAEADSMINA